MYRSILDIPFRTAERFPSRVSHQFRVGDTTETRSFAQFATLIRELTAGFKELGIEKGNHVGFFVNNRYEWIATDFALMALGAVSVPRGSDTTPSEVRFIFRHSDSSYLVLENVGQLAELATDFEAPDWAACRSILIMDNGVLEGVPAAVTDKVVFYDAVLDSGRTSLAAEPGLVEELAADIDPDDLLTIVYTSGTTGNPKGVMLTHANFLQNVVANTPRLEIDAAKAEKTVVMLPSWHVYERAFEYCALESALTLVYSSAKRFAADLLEVKPEILISVPRVWESIYQKMIKAISQMPAFKRYLIFGFIKINQMFLVSAQYLRGCYISLKKRNPIRKVVTWLGHLVRVLLLFPGHLLAGVLFKPFRARVGGRLRGATSAAGSLPKYLDELFNSIGITIVNAYGMTECAPGILSRTFGRNTFGSTGIPFDNTEVQIRREDGSETAIGEKGVVFARGPQVMKGYYKNPDATAKVLSDDGWLNTGDLAVRSENGEVIIVGRLKDTIVLMGGENVEPEPIEDKMKESLYIDHAVVLGQDQKQLSAIVAVNEEELMRLAGELKMSVPVVETDGEHSIEHHEIYDILMKEVNALISREHGFKPFEAIGKILPVRNTFQIGRELTQTLKVKRKVIEEKYKSLIKRLFEDTEGKRRK
jgi:long-chain acyl-CoA synthetase